MFDFPIPAPARDAREDEFLDQHIFQGLRRLTVAFDSPKIHHCRAEAFLRILERCTRFRVAVYGVEVFTETAELVAVKIALTGSPEEFVPMVAWACGKSYLSVCASFGVPDDLLQGQSLA
jgi:hypothetical protein